MPKKPATEQQLLAENERLRVRLAQAEETLREMHSGEVDALFLSGVGGAQLFTLKDADQSFRILVEEMSEGALTMTADGVIVYANRRLAGMLKTPLEKVTGSAVRSWIAPASQPILHSLLEKSASEGRHGELSLAAGDGTRVPVYLSVSNLPISGSSDAYCLVAIDLTEHNRIEAIAASERAAQALLAAANQSREELLRVIDDKERAETALRASQQLLTQTYNALDQAIFVVNPANRTVITCNASAIDVFGYQRDELIGRTTEFLHVDQATFEEFGRRLFSTLEATDSFHTELQMRRKNGEIFFAEVTVTEIHDNAGRRTGVVSVARDITERKRAEHEIRDLNTSLERRVAERTAQLEEASRAKSDFLANMSHELRTPLNSIIGFSEMLKEGALGELDAKQHVFIADIADAGKHLLSLINDILDLSKVEAGMLQLDAGAVDAPALLKASLLVVREKAHAHRIRLDTGFDPALGTMLGDERKLKQIAYNLLSNAVKFTPDGGAVTLSARRCTRAEVAFDGAWPNRLIALPPGEDDKFLAIAVEDTGMGIAEEHLPQLFEPFMQVDSSIARRQDGTGLGLSLVRRFAELHGGTVGVASCLGAGSRFCVWLPYREFAPAVQEGQMASEGTARSAPAVPLALVIEDDDGAAEMIAAQLRAEGFETMRAATAEEGLVRAAKRRPQLITLDIALPAMDGLEFMRQLKADPKLARTPVVIITASDDRGRGLALGARFVLRKPIVRGELSAALAELRSALPKRAGD